MPLDLQRDDDPDGFVSLADDLLEKLPARLGVKTRLWERLAREYYDDPRIHAADVRELVAETTALRARLIEPIHPGTLAKKPPPELAVLDALLKLCNQALAAGEGLIGISD